MRKATLLVLLMVGCAKQDARHTAIEAEVYASIIDSLLTGCDEHIVVLDEASDPSASQYELRDGLDAHLKADYRELNGGTRSIRGLLPNKPQVTLARRDAFEAAGAYSTLQFSSVGLNAEGTLAMVQYTYHCGVTCGHGGTWLFEKTPAGWHIKESIGSVWVS